MDKFRVRAGVMLVQRQLTDNTPGNSYLNAWRTMHQSPQKQEAAVVLLCMSFLSPGPFVVPLKIATQHI